MTLQEEVEQFLNNTGDEPYKEAVYALLRKFVEKCCGETCSMCYDNISIIRGSTVYHRLDNFDKNRYRTSEMRVYRYKGEGVYECSAHSIRHHFAWLLEKRQEK